MSRHHDRWRNGEGQRHRKRIAASLPQPCCRCGRTILPTDPPSSWQADHLVPLARIPEGSTVPPGMIRPACTKCNLAAGGRDGSRITNARKRATKNEPRGIRAW